MKTARFRLLSVALLALLALPLAACGNKEAETKVGSTEGAYLNVGPLLYQVQISRELNPKDVEDHSYFLGLPEGTQPLDRDETWFAVFMRVQNETDEAAPTADLADYDITDTQGIRYTPVAIDADANPFAYAPTVLAADSIYPDPSGVAGSGTIQGSMLLFRVSFQSIADRPLTLTIRDPEDPSDRAMVDLDV